MEGEEGEVSALLIPALRLPRLLRWLWSLHLCAALELWCLVVWIVVVVVVVAAAAAVVVASATAV